MTWRQRYLNSDLTWLRWPEFWHYIYCFVQFGEALRWKEINTHTHTHTHVHTHTHTHTQSQKTMTSSKLTIISRHFADVKYCQYLFLHIKIICWRFHIKTPFTFWDMCTWDMWKVCLQTFTNNRICWKLAYFSIILWTWRAHNSRILRIKKIKFSGYCFYMNTRP